MGDMSNNNAFRSSHAPTSYMRSGRFGSSSASPPGTAFFKEDMFNHASTSANGQIYGTSPTAERHPTDRNGNMPALAASSSDPSNFGVVPSILIRRLPISTTLESLKSMLLFAGDIVDLDFVQLHRPEDTGFMAASVRFQTAASAVEAKQKLNGKPNTTKEANMIVETYDASQMPQFDQRRNTIDGTAARTQTSSTSSSSSIGPAPTGRSRYGGTFQSVSGERISPPLMSSGSGGNGDYPFADGNSRLQSRFSPHSPLANGVNGHHRISGKSMINDDSGEDETGSILNDLVAASATRGQQHATRRSTNPASLVNQLGGLSISSPSNGMHFGPPSAGGLASPRGNSAMQHTLPHPMSPGTVPNGGSNSPYNITNFHHAQYPPVNPADQNPPCNTLYVGNLPADTSEDELKSLFSRQRGYKRLCFRTKQNGPMCFVEFEDVSFATKALNDLYGHLLHNSTKGGIRLSFSKNPLGVRAGHTNGAGPNAAMSPQALSPGYAGAINGFSSVSGPPPGLAQPPGLANGVSYRAPAPTTPGLDGMFSHHFAMGPPDYGSQISPRNAYSGAYPANVPSSMQGIYPRDSRNASYSEYAPRK